MECREKGKKEINLHIYIEEIILKYCCDFIKVLVLQY